MDAKPAEMISQEVERSGRGPGFRHELMHDLQGPNSVDNGYHLSEYWRERMCLLVSTWL